MSTPLKWFKSSYSGSEGGQCLEVAVSWRKSSHSSDQGGQCVEVAICTCADTVHVRDSKVTDGPTLALTPAAWTDLTRWVRV
ncbi:MULTISPECIES: DUF397 domain-containing protein [unclassified Streptomyces]|uniref:DUF397 domain-containing protein n=1 Tax=unclassified Streptomyces TaxID=2593676 RepID=UPI0029A91934|nr:DUF397 domain-containing protein [Streptomyces sp. DK15]MDX2395534.1 DUF397 domain-containing protein [Streptomyces sp. DK15]